MKLKIKQKKPTEKKEASKISIFDNNALVFCGKLNSSCEKIAYSLHLKTQKEYISFEIIIKSLINYIITRMSPGTSVMIGKSIIKNANFKYKSGRYYIDDIDVTNSGKTPLIREFTHSYLQNPYLLNKLNDIYNLLIEEYGNNIIFSIPGFIPNNRKNGFIFLVKSSIKDRELNLIKTQEGFGFTINPETSKKQISADEEVNKKSFSSLREKNADIILNFSKNKKNILKEIEFLYQKNISRKEK